MTKDKGDKTGGSTPEGALDLTCSALLPAEGEARCKAYVMPYDFSKQL